MFYLFIIVKISFIRNCSINVKLLKLHLFFKFIVFFFFFMSQKCNFIWFNILFKWERDWNDVSKAQIKIFKYWTHLVSNDSHFEASLYTFNKKVSIQIFSLLNILKINNLICLFYQMIYLVLTIHSCYFLLFFIIFNAKKKIN